MLTSKQVKEIMKEDICSLMAKVEELENIIHHCWVHSGYNDCGSSKMTEEEKKHYVEAVINTQNKIIYKS